MYEIIFVLSSLIATFFVYIDMSKMNIKNSYIVVTIFIGIGYGCLFTISISIINNIINLITTWK